jgi:hypothetical protein
MEAAVRETSLPWTEPTPPAAQDPAVFNSLSLTPGALTIVANAGGTLNALAFDQYGASFALPTIAAHSSDVTKATVSVSGSIVTVTGVAAGSTTVTVTSGVATSNSVVVTVTAVPTPPVDPPPIDVPPPSDPGPIVGHGQKPKITGKGRNPKITGGGL